MTRRIPSVAMSELGKKNCMHETFEVEQKKHSTKHEFVSNELWDTRFVLNRFKSSEMVWEKSLKLFNLLCMVSSWTVTWSSAAEIRLHDTSCEWSSSFIMHMFDLCYWVVLPLTTKTKAKAMVQRRTGTLFARWRNFNCLSCECEKKATLVSF